MATVLAGLSAGALLLAEVLRYRWHRREFAKMSAASDRLTASLSALTASVEALLAKPAPADDSAALLALADHADALKAKVDAAVNPPPAA